VSATPSPYHPRSVVAIAIYGVISAEIGLLWAFVWNPAWEAGNLSDRIFGFIGMPIDAMLLVGSAGLLMLRPWSRKWMVNWAIIATVYATLVLLTGIIWPVSNSNLGDTLPPGYKNQLGDIDSGTKDMIVGVIRLVAWIGWLSTLSLSLWVLWAMTRPIVLPYFETENGVPQPSLSQNLSPRGTK
jgi:hypothetical protein